MKEGNKGAAATL